MAYTTIDDPSAHFKVQLYTGNGGANHAITFDDTDTDMQPDLVWIKNRDATDSHCIFDAVRGATKLLSSDSTNAETTDTDTLDSFTSDGFQVDADVKVNTNAEDYVAWCWKANGSGSSNTDGSINTAATSANTTAGFSILTWTANNTAGATVGHGLSSAPKMVIVKNRTSAFQWTIHHQYLTDASYVLIFTTAAQSASTAQFNDTAPSSSVITLGAEGNTNSEDGNSMVAYAFSEIQGFSKFGTYEGNNNADGTFVYTGFTPAYVLVKNIDASGPKWTIQDTKRSPSGGGNPAEARLHPNDTTVEEADSDIDLLSNGFKIRSTGSYQNDVDTYIYMAFAEAPFANSNGVPCNAR